MKTICIYCGSRRGCGADYANAARRMGELLAQRAIHLIYGAGGRGLMGVLADAALAAGGQVTGVIPAALVEMEAAHHHLTKLEIVDSMHERKARMADLAEAFIALPGGFGTLEELFEILTWAQLGIHHKPCGLLNVGGYFDHLIRLLDHAVEQGFLTPATRALLVEETDPERLLDQIVHYQPPPFQPKITPEET